MHHTIACVYLQGFNANTSPLQEGYRSDGRGEIPSGWLHDGYKGVDARALIANPNIDYQTVHFYGESFAIEPWNWTSYFTYYAANRALMARTYDAGYLTRDCTPCSRYAVQ